VAGGSGVARAGVPRFCWLGLPRTYFPAFEKGGKASALWRYDKVHNMGYNFAMAKVSYVSIPVGLETAYARVLMPNDRFQFSRVSVKRLFLSRAKIKGITQKSLMVSLAPVWAALSPTEQAAWTAAGAVSKMSGWKLFLQDTADRLKAGETGYATPNTTYQSMVGRITVASPATGLQIEQPHPSTYYVQRKVPLTRSQYVPVAVNEPLTLPLTIGIAWKTALTALGGDARARFYVTVTSSYQGTDIKTTLSIPFGFSDSWTSATATLSTVKGIARYYEAYIEVYNARGDLYFDNVNITHGGQNWARDPHCLNVQEAFTRAFFQVPAHWAATNPADGAEFASVYFVP